MGGCDKVVREENGKKYQTFLEAFSTGEPDMKTLQSYSKQDLQEIMGDKESARALYNLVHYKSPTSNSIKRAATTNGSGSR